MRVPTAHLSLEANSEYSGRSLSSRGRTKFVGIAGFLVEIAIIMLVTVSSLYFQVIGRPTDTAIYYTNEPWDTQRRGEQYTCGCNLPATVQGPQNPSEAKGDILNKCYEKSALENVTIFMFQNSTPVLATLGPLLEALGPDQVSYATVSTGYVLGQEAHDMARRSDRDYPTPLRRDINKLYLGGQEQPDQNLTIDSLQGASFMSFPSTYLRLAFSYRCSDCPTCSIHSVSAMARNVSPDRTWASCFYWYNGDNCITSNDYMAKCVLYPTGSLPFHFAIRTFLQDLQNLTGVDPSSIQTADSESSGWSPTANESVSLHPSALYMNFSQVGNGSISLGFVEVGKGSAGWISLLNLFPDMDRNCSGLTKFKICNGTSVCNVFNNDKTGTYDSECFNFENSSSCQRVSDTYTVDAAKTLIQMAGKDESKMQENDWFAVMCPNFRCEEVPPYLVSRVPWLNGSESGPTSMDSLNQFLYTAILEDEWAQLSSPCTNTFENVLRYPPNEEPQTSSASGEEGFSISKEHTPQTRFLQAQCTETGPVSYCWLTGFYSDRTQLPSEDWKFWNSSEFGPPKDRFVCYRVGKKGMLAWCIVIVSIVFGWIGTVHLMFECLWWVVKKSPGWSKACQRHWQERWGRSVDDSTAGDKPGLMGPEPGTHVQDPQLKSPVSDRLSSAVKRTSSMVRTSDGV